MITAIALLLFTILCIVLSGDGAWDNVTKPERNELVFEGRHQGYGAFPLRREYDRRFVIAFFGAVGMVGLGLAVTTFFRSAGVHADPPRHVMGTDVILPPTPPPTTHNDAPKPTPKPTPPINKTQPPTGPVEGSIDTLPKDPKPLRNDTLGTSGPVDPKPGSTGLPGGGGTTASADSGKAGPPGPPIRHTSGTVDVAPQFPGGEKALARFIQDNLHVSDPSITRATARVIFVVDVDGSVIDVRAQGHAEKAFKEAVERVVKAMPRWKPALFEKELVPCVMVLPITYGTQ